MLKKEEFLYFWCQFRSKSDSKNINIDKNDLFVVVSNKDIFLDFIFAVNHSDLFRFYKIDLELV